MGIRVELEMLAVLLFLTPIVIDGVVLTKCQLVNDLQSAVPTTMQDRDTVIAKLVRQAETVANFNTSFTIQINAPSDTGKGRIARSAPKSSAKAAAKPPAKVPAKTKTPAKPPAKPANASPPKATQSPKLQNTTAKINMAQMGPMINQTPPANSSQSNDQMAPPSNGSQKWTLYSLFLIPDVVACTAPNVSSFNVCNMPCNELLNNDITSATNCMLTILDSSQSNDNPEPDQNGANSIIDDLCNKFMQSYQDLNSTTYLAECSKQ